MKTESVNLVNIYELKIRVIGGTLYQSGAVTQVHWDDNGIETWTAPNAEQAIENYWDMASRWRASTPQRKRNALQHLHSDNTLNHSHKGYGLAIQTPGASPRIGSWLSSDLENVHEHPSLKQLFPKRLS